MAKANERLYISTGRRKMSPIIVLDRALAEKLRLLRKAYTEAEEDPDRKEVISDWAILDGEDWN